MAEKEMDTLDGSIKLLSSAWKGLILNIDDGTGALAKFVRGTIDLSAGLINVISSVSTVSDGFWDFFLNLKRVADGQGALIGSEAAIQKGMKLRKGLLDELSGLMQKDFEQRGLKNNAVVMFKGG